MEDQEIIHGHDKTTKFPYKLVLVHKRQRVITKECLRDNEPCLVPVEDVAGLDSEW